LSGRGPAYSGFRGFCRVGACRRSTQLILRHERPRYDGNQENRGASSSAQHNATCSGGKTRSVRWHMNHFPKVRKRLLAERLPCRVVPETRQLFAGPEPLPQ
jgi:hypothetical protein